MRTTSSTEIIRVPFLGDIPLIGALFRHKEKLGDERELIIFMTPTIQGASPSGNNNANSFDMNSRERSSVVPEVNKEMDRLGY